VNCIGHQEPAPESWAQLETRYGEDGIGFVAELAKKNGERKLMHEMLNTAGVPTKTPEGRDLCLIARLAIFTEGKELTHERR
jgi:hypothetical protein